MTNVAFQKYIDDAGKKDAALQQTPRTQGSKNKNDINNSRTKLQIEDLEEQQSTMLSTPKADKLPSPRIVKPSAASKTRKKKQPISKQKQVAQHGTKAVKVMADVAW